DTFLGFSRENLRKYEKLRSTALQARACNALRPAVRIRHTMLSDRARIHVQAGGGGDGCMSFRRESRVPKGGPDGGDGARGGDVVLVCDDSLRDLQFFRRTAHFKARRGGHGRGALRFGPEGERLEVHVP